MSGPGVYWPLRSSLYFLFIPSRISLKPSLPPKLLLPKHDLRRRKRLILRKRAPPLRRLMWLVFQDMSSSAAVPIEPGNASARAFLEVLQNCNIFNDGAWEILKDPEGAKRALIPIENKRNFLDVSADIMEHVDPIFYGDPKTAAMKVLGLN